MSRRRPRTASMSGLSDWSTTDEEVVDIRRSTRTAATRNPHLVANVIALGVAGLAALAFVGVVLNALVLAVGVLNPAWQTYKSLELSDDNSDLSDDEDRDYVPPDMVRANWASYWLLAALLFIVVELVSLPAAFVTLPQPIIPALLVPALLYLTRDGARNSRRVYDEVARPLLKGAETHVDGSITAAVRHIEYFTSVALVQIYAFIEPYTKQLRRAAAASARTIQANTSNGQQEPRRRRRRSILRRGEVD